MNNFFIHYNNSNPSPSSHIDVSLVEKIASPDDLFILRGEPNYHPQLHDLLDVLKNSRLIYTTHAFNIDALLSYKRTLPYVSFHYDGIQNDRIKQQSGLTVNILRALNAMSSHVSVTRLAYTLSPFNKDWIDGDIGLLRQFYENYRNMKKPYFLIYQQGKYFSQPNFAWTSINKTFIDHVNRSGILSQKDLQFFLSFFSKVDYNCLALQDELVIDWNGDVRLCMSHRWNEIIGNIRDQSLEDIKASTKDIRQTSQCPVRHQCWMAYHYKDSIQKMVEQHGNKRESENST